MYIYMPLNIHNAKQTDERYLIRI